MSVASPMRPTQVARWFGIGERRLVNLDTHGVLSALSFNENDRVLYFDQAWLWKAIDIVRTREGI